MHPNSTHPMHPTQPNPMYPNPMYPMHRTLHTLCTSHTPTLCTLHPNPMHLNLTHPVHPNPMHPNPMNPTHPMPPSTPISQHSDWLSSPPQPITVAKNLRMRLICHLVPGIQRGKICFWSSSVE